MNITLLNYTNEAEKLLIFTKHTRRMDGIKAWEELENLNEGEKAEELNYILQTISGPWEFIDYTFFIQGVTRAFTHQLVRHRVGTSFAQESLRIADKKDFEYLDETFDSMLYSSIMDNIQNGYSELIRSGVPIQVARGVLPTNILTNITMKINLRALNSMMNTRLCVRASGEFQEAAKIIRGLVIAIHPWAERVLLPFCLEWGTCKFQAYNDCPLKKVHPWLKKKNDEISCEARRDWEKILGFSPQPK
jgi:flavin-dependent thymidylate synthase